MDFEKFKNNMGAFIAASLMVCILLGAGFIFIYNENTKQHQRELEFKDEMHAKELTIKTQENSLKFFKQNEAISNLSKSVKKYTEQIDNLKSTIKNIQRKNNKLHKEISKHKLFKTQKRELSLRGNWINKELNFSIKMKNKMTIGKSTFIIFDVKLPDTLEYKEEVYKTKYKSYSKRFTKSNQDFELTIKQFHPTIFILKKI